MDEELLLDELEAGLGGGKATGSGVTCAAGSLCGVCGRSSTAAAGGATSGTHEPGPGQGCAQTLSQIAAVEPKAPG